MDSELSILLKNIKDKTGIDIVVFSEGMKFFVTTAPSKEIYAPTDKDFDGVYQDILTGNTYFRVKYKNNALIGYVRGIGHSEKIYASLITDLIESSSSKELQLSQQEYLKSILLGECNRVQIQKYEKKYSTPNKPCFVLVVSPSGQKHQDVLDVLANYDTSGGNYAVSVEDGSYAYLKFTDSSTDDYQSSTDFAEFLVQSIKEETGVSVNIGVGCTVKSIYEVSTSFQQALMAVRMCTVMNSKGEVHSFKEYLLLKMLEDLPKFKLSEYLDILLDDNAKDIFSDAEMINTAEEFLENSLNISETSRKLYLHRNTLMYRLDKIERETGLNIRKFSDAVTFRLITMLVKLIK
jgi:carbohydrate diacid regulator